MFGIRKKAALGDNLPVANKIEVSDAANQACFKDIDDCSDFSSDYSTHTANALTTNRKSTVST